MKAMALWALIVVSAVSFAGQNNLFEELDSQFADAVPPTDKDPQSYWAGYCVQPTSPGTAHPAVYVSKLVVHEEGMIEEYRSQSYFWEKEGASDKFYNYTPQQVENYGPIKEYFKKEQWQPTFLEEDALTNYFNLSDGSRVQRSVRLYETEFTKSYIVRITRVTGMGSEIINYCYFPKNLGKIEDPEQPTVPFYLNTGAVSNSFVELKSPTTKKGVKGILINKAGFGRITLSEIQVTLADGTIKRWDPIQMAGAEQRYLTLKDQELFSLSKFRFYLSGYTPNLEIQAITK